MMMVLLVRLTDYAQMAQKMRVQCCMVRVAG